MKAILLSFIMFAFLAMGCSTKQPIELEPIKKWEVFMALPDTVLLGSKEEACMDLQTIIADGIPMQSIHFINKDVEEYMEKCRDKAIKKGKVL